MTLDFYPPQTGHILGAGALGCLWGGTLSQHYPIRYIAKPQPYPPALSEIGFTLTSLSGIAHDCRLPLESPVSNDLPSIEKLLVFTKSFDVESAFDGVKSRLNENSLIVLFQNGMGAQQRLADRYPDLLIYAATTTEGAYKNDEGVIHAGAGNTLIGPLSQRAKAKQENREPLINWLQQSPFSIQPTDHIQLPLWKKLAINCCINPFTAILNCPNGDIRQHAFFQERLQPLSEEIVTCAAQEGISLDQQEIQSQVLAVLEATQHNISSMLQDIRAGRKTEIAAINGYILELSERHHLCCPVNQSLYLKVLNMHP